MHTLLSEEEDAAVESIALLDESICTRTIAH
jgi:hypothetical protein